MRATRGENKQGEKEFSGKKSEVTSLDQVISDRMMMSAERKYKPFDLLKLS